MPKNSRCVINLHHHLHCSGCRYNGGDGVCIKAGFPDMNLKQTVGWTAGALTLILTLVILQGPLARPDGVAFSLVSGIRARQAGQVRAALNPTRWAPAFERNPEGLFSPRAVQEPNLAGIAGQPFRIEKIAETPPQPFAVNQACDKFLFCPERATITYRLSFTQPQPYLFPPELVMGGWQRRILQEGQVKVYGEHPDKAGAIFLSRRLSVSAQPVAMPMSVMYFKPDMSQLDPAVAGTFDKEQAGSVAAGDGHALSETEIAALLPRLSTLTVLVEVQRPDLFTPWKVEGFGFTKATVLSPAGETFTLREAAYR